MKREDMIINYRPKLAELMKKHMTDMLMWYNLNPIATYYYFLSQIYLEKGEEDTAILFQNASMCIVYSDFDTFEREYRKVLNSIIHGAGEITEAKAANALFSIYSGLIDDMEVALLQCEKDLTKSEQYMIKRFCHILASPTRNPNIKIQEGKTQCYYDEYKWQASFSKDLKASLEWVQTNCEDIINIFGT